MNKTREEYLEETKKELGEKEFVILFHAIDNEFYSKIQEHVKRGNKISRNVYESLSPGQRYHFNHRYHFRGGSGEGLIAKGESLFSRLLCY